MRQTKEDLYRFICSEFAQSGFSDFKEIPYGLQFHMDGSLIRIYQSKKKGITLDLSQSSDSALNEKLNNVYEKFQGNVMHSSDFSIGSGKITYPILSPPVAGSDEVGKGDFFTPLIVGTVFLETHEYDTLKRLGVKDSKDLTDEKISSLAEEIKKVTKNYKILVVSQKQYNEMYEKIGNINEILAMAHIHNLKKLHEMVPYKNAIIDRFGREKEMHSALSDLKLNLKIEPKAEKNVAVAAASILARERLIRYMDNMSKHYDFDFPLGASSMVISRGKEFVKKYGKDEMKNVSKLHFKTYMDIIH